MSRNSYIENVVTMLCMTALILGLFWMGAGGWSLCGLLLFMNMNYPADKE